MKHTPHMILYALTEMKCLLLMMQHCSEYHPNPQNKFEKEHIFLSENLEKRVSHKIQQTKNTREMFQLTMSDIFFFWLVTIRYMFHQ